MVPLQQLTVFCFLYSSLFILLQPQPLSKPLNQPELNNQLKMAAPGHKQLFNYSFVYTPPPRPSGIALWWKICWKQPPKLQILNSKLAGKAELPTAAGASMVAVSHVLVKRIWGLTCKAQGPGEQVGVIPWNKYLFCLCLMSVVAANISASSSGWTESIHIRCPPYYFVAIKPMMGTHLKDDAF